ncbi:MAG TPA: BON domain-containing protein [Gemmatimonadaceae bacterium]|nr:BON domain-containing protein [Gemmatimonadaceae bacterium]
MADDYDNTDELINLTDDELRTVVITELKAHNAIDSDDVEVHVRNGNVRVEGRIGAETELRTVDHILTDILNLKDVRNNLVVDEIRRAESPEAIDEHLVDEDEHAGLLLGDRASQQDPEAEHLVTDRNLNPGGTHDVSQAIEAAEPWIPPEGPTPEGLDGQEYGDLGVDAQH